MANVFLSYDHEDIALARPIASALEKAGHTVWYDRHIHGGAQYSRKIEQALDDADAVVVLWSANSLESAWVRDEAAEGRDRGKLVPLSIGGVAAPMGFRQFQIIDLGAWKGRGKVPRLASLLEAIDSQAPDDAKGAAQTKVTRQRTTPLTADRKPSLIALAVLLLLVAAGTGAWLWWKPGGLPAVTVEPADSSPRSQAMAGDLFVKLGALAEIGQGKWQLLDSDPTGTDADLVFRTADTGTPGQPKANLVLLDGSDEGLLWSREFDSPAGGEADMRQQLASTAGRVLGCALESRESGGLPRASIRPFLNACAMMAETSMDQPEKVARPLRRIAQENPRFAPVWGKLLYLESTIVDLAGLGGGNRDVAVRSLNKTLESARRYAPDSPELVLAELNSISPRAYEQRLNLVEKAVARGTDEAKIFAEQAGLLASVGRMGEAVHAARRAAELEPLSPAAATQLIMTLAYAGQIAEAREELALAERNWAGTGALRDAQWSFHLRFGDPQLARKLATFNAAGLDHYLAARADPSPTNVGRLISLSAARPDLGDGRYGFVLQALAEFGSNDDVLRWIARMPTDGVAGGSYMLFRPGFAKLRRDPRFMQVARRIGLTEYWLSSGEWPDFCREPGLPYDCKAEASRSA